MAIIRVRNDDGVIIDIPAIVGPPGADYVLTEADKAEIAAQAAELVEVPEGGEADLTGYATEQWVQEGYQPKGDYLPSTELPTAINTALAQAEESGEFKGDPGKDGKSAYQYAQDGGYVGTEEEFADMMAGNILEPADGDRPLVFFGAPLQQTKDEIVCKFRYYSKTLKFHCWAKIKAQGNSTMSWPKKNQTVKLYEDAECTIKFKIDFKGWGEQNKFVIKAYWRDLTHVRDIVSVRLEGDCMRSNPDYDELPELLKTSPNMGGVDGFPVVVYAAGVYQGRYMFCIPKDAWMANMDDDVDEHCILCSEGYSFSCLFRGTATIDGSDWTDEIHDTVPVSIKERWNEVSSFVRHSTDEEFVANLDSYIKVSTLIDRHIMGLYSCDFDGYGKNQKYLTYDGKQWYAGRYDKDGTWGNFWSGDNMLPSNYSREQYEDMTSDRAGNLLFIRLEQLFWQRLQERWNYLRDNELSVPNTINRFRELYDITPPHVIEEDYASTTANGAFTGIPNKTTCTIQQIQNFVLERHAWMDEYVAALSPDEPAESYTNQVPTSIDTDGSVFNGVGYQNGYRISTSTGEAKVAATSTVSGYIPAKAGDVIRVYGVDWYNPSGTNNAVAAYDSNFGYIGAVYGTFKGTGTSITQDEAIVNDNDIMVTLKETGVAYIRVGSMGLGVTQDGANMIVTVNEEIT